MLSKFQIEKDFSKLEDIIRNSGLTSEELHSLYAISLMEDLKKIKQKLSGDKLEITLLIKKLLFEDRVVVDKVQNIIENYRIKNELKKLVLENEQFFETKEDIENVLKFIEGRLRKIEIFWDMDLKKVTVFYYPENLKNLLIYLKTCKSIFENSDGNLSKLKILIK